MTPAPIIATLALSAITALSTLSALSALSALASPLATPPPSQPALSSAPSLPPPASSPSAPRDQVDVIEHLNQHLPIDLRFFDAFQNQLALREVFNRGKPVLLTLVYFDCPMLCSTLVQGLVRSLNETGLQLGKDYSAITVSFNPKDTPRESAVYQSGYLRALRGIEKAAPQDWLFLTGQESQSRALADSVGFKYRWDPQSAQFEHPAVAFVLTPDGRISRYLYGVQVPARELRLSLVEASGGKVGTSFDRVLLKCFKYDPASRRYHLYVFGFVRAGAFLVFAALAIGLALLWRRELKKGTVA